MPHLIVAAETCKTKLKNERLLGFIRASQEMTVCVWYNPVPAWDGEWSLRVLCEIFCAS